MGVRHEKVVLTLEDHFTSGMARAAAQTALLRRNVEQLNKEVERNGRATGTQADSLDRLNRELRSHQNALQNARNGLNGYNQQTQQASRNTGNLANQIDRTSGRLGLLIEAGVLLGPALIPIGATAVPAITGLTAQLGFAAVAAGVAVSAFIGMGDAIEAVMDAAKDPSIDNLVKASEAMEALSPQAREVVAQLGHMRTAFGGLKAAAQDGLFPGVIRGLQDLERLLPRLESLFETIGSATGEAFANVAESLGSERWAGFLDFLEEEAPETIHETTMALGALAHGLAELWMAFDPLNDDFSRWMLGAARSFDSWAANLAETQGFRDFVDFVRQSGPQVADAMGALTNALVQVTQAASPLGGPVLEALERIFDVIAGIAESPIGPRLVTMAAAMVILNRVMSAGTAIMGRFGGAANAAAGGAGSGAAGGGLAAFRQRIDGARTSVGAFRRDLGTVATSMMTAGATSQREAQRTAAAMANLRTTAATAGRVVGGSAAGVAAFAVASGAVGSNMDLQNTAMLGLVGSMKGPYGAAIGASIGALIDMQKAGEEAEAAIDRLNVTMASAESIDAMHVALGTASGELDALMEKADKFGGLNLTAAGMGFDYIFSGFDIEDTAIGRAAEELDKSEDYVANLELSLRDLGKAMQMPRETGADLTAVLQAAAPAMQALGISTDDLADAATDGSIVDLVEQLSQWDDVANAASYSIIALGDSFRHLTEQLSGRSAIRGYEEAIDSVTESIEEHGRTLDIDTAAGRANSEALDGIAASALEVANTLSGDERTTFLERAREDLIQAGIQFGMTREAAAGFAESLGLSMALTQRSTSAARGEAQLLAQDYSALPYSVRTEIDTYGIPQTVAQVDALVLKYDLAEQDRTTLMALQKTAAENGLRSYLDLLALAERERVATITTRYRTEGRPPPVVGGSARAVATGGVFSSVTPARIVEQYAQGGIDRANAHQPEITRPGSPLRIWSEPETMGEAYIPLANDWRRPRAINIWQQTGRELGVMHFADGGLRDALRSQTFTASGSTAATYAAERAASAASALAASAAAERREFARIIAALPREVYDGARAGVKDEKGKFGQQRKVGGR